MASWAHIFNLLRLQKKDMLLSEADVRFDDWSLTPRVASTAVQKAIDAYDQRDQVDF